MNIEGFFIFSCSVALKASYLRETTGGLSRFLAWVGIILEPMEGFFLIWILGMIIFGLGWIWLTLWTVEVEYEELTDLVYYKSRAV